MFTPTIYAPSLDTRTIDVLLEALVRLNVLYLNDHPDTPELYSSGVRYKREPPGKEDWLSIPEAIKRGVADCEDLCCWRAAELRFDGFQAMAFSSREPSKGPRPLFHVRVRLGGGRIVEDPSAVLGMR